MIPTTPMKDHLVLVTGINGGNGRAIAKRLKESGYFILGLDVAEDPSCSHPYCDQYINIDLRSVRHSKQRIYDLVSKCNSERLSIVNNAGITLPVEDATKPYPLDSWDTTISVNLTAPFIIIETLRQLLCEYGHSIVNITSLAAHAGFPNNPAYIAAKSGLLGLSRAYAYDFGAFGVTVNSVSPGYIQTPMTSLSFSNPDRNSLIRAHTHLGQWGSPSDVASCVNFLLSEEARYITGADLSVDGGWLSRGLIQL